MARAHPKFRSPCQCPPFGCFPAGAFSNGTLKRKIAVQSKLNSHLCLRVLCFFVFLTQEENKVKTSVCRNRSLTFRVSSASDWRRKHVNLAPRFPLIQQFRPRPICRPKTWRVAKWLLLRSESFSFQRQLTNFIRVRLGAETLIALFVLEVPRLICLVSTGGQSALPIPCGTRRHACMHVLYIYKTLLSAGL